MKKDIMQITDEKITEAEPSNTTKTVLQNLIYTVRGQQIMLDSDLAALYQVETKRLNEAVKRNIERFPEKFRFQLTDKEYMNLKSQIATSSWSIEDGLHGGRRKLPYVDIVTLNMLAKKNDGVAVKIYTVKRTALTEIDINKFNSQYPSLEITCTNMFHDRFLIIDDRCAYHIGASLKDAGKKCFAVTKIEDVKIIGDIIQRLKP